LLVESKKQYFVELNKRVVQEYKEHIVYPKFDDIFRALELTDYQSCKVLILGQDPYHKIGQAIGLSFAVQLDCKIPYSLQNIFKEVLRDIGYVNTKRDLINWVNQGVLLLNTVLTVQEGNPNSHKNFGWQQLINAIIHKLAQKDKLVVMLWGKNAQSMEKYFDKSRHLVLCTSHPSPLSVYNGFDGCGHFSRCNQYLVENGMEKIDW